MVLAQNTHRQNRGAQNKPTDSQVLTKKASIYNEKKTVSLAIAVGKAGQQHGNE